VCCWRHHFVCDQLRKLVPLGGRQAEAWHAGPLRTILTNFRGRMQAAYLGDRAKLAIKMGVARRFIDAIRPALGRAEGGPHGFDQHRGVRRKFGGFLPG